MSPALARFALAKMAVPVDPMRVALARLLAAHDALVANVSPATAHAYEEAVSEARRAHRAVEERSARRVAR